MGANVYLKGVASFGYKTEAKSTKIWHGIQAMPGARIAIRSYAAKHGHATVASHLWFMKVLGRTTLSTAAAASATTVVLTATQTYANAASDWVAVIDDEGYTNFARAVSWTAASKKLTIDTALAAAAAAGNNVYVFGVTTDAGHIASKTLAAGGTVNSDALDGGIFYAAAKGDPMIAILTNPSSPSAIESLTVDYIDK